MVVAHKVSPYAHYATWPSPFHGYEGPTTISQLETEEEILALLSEHWAQTDGPNKPDPELYRQVHLKFMAKCTLPIPGTFLSADSNRVWFIYWVTHTFELLGTPWGSNASSMQVGASKDPRTRAADTILSFQNPVTGGFGGGRGHSSHLMSSYAAVMALAIVGGPVDGTPSSSNSAWDQIDRQKMYTWMMSLKQSDGSFVITQGGETDIRGIYCVLCISLALGICTPELLRGVESFTASCQTYEGGISAASYSFGDAEEPASVLGEAHGGYAYCAIATQAMLLRLRKGCSLSRHQAHSVPGKLLAGTSMDLAAFCRWAIHLQGRPIEGGAFRGRVNKLVDGCYGWFTGSGLFTCLEAAMDLDRASSAHLRGGDKAHPPTQNKQSPPDQAETSISSSPSSADVVDTCSAEREPPAQESTWLFDHAALQEYILVCAQNTPAQGGGFKDKPSSQPDAYHACYNLAALSLCQHRVLVCDETYSAMVSAYHTDLSPSKRPGRHTEEEEPAATVHQGARTEQATGTDQVDNDWRALCYASCLGWTIDEKQGYMLGGEKNMVAPTHPIFNVSFLRIKQMMDYFYAKD